MSRLLADLVIALGNIGVPRSRIIEIHPPPGLPPRVMVVGAEPDLARRIASMNQPIDVLHITDAQAEDLIRRFDASNSPVDTLPALPPRPEWAEALQAFEPAAKDAERAMAQLAKVWPQPQRKPAPCAGHSRHGRPFRVGGETRRPGTADVDKRAKRKAAEKSRRRNRK